jgi:hypothetical protein
VGTGALARPTVLIEHIHDESVGLVRLDPPSNRRQSYNEQLPQFIRDPYAVREWKHASAILYEDFPKEWHDIVEVLTNFTLKKSFIVSPGGGRSPVSGALDQAFYSRQWIEKKFETKVVVDEVEFKSPTHKVDCYKNRVAVEIEWNNKTEFYDRDLNNFRLLFDLRAISVGVIVTRCDELVDLAAQIGRGGWIGPSTTLFSKLIYRLEGGSGGGCPVLAFGITKRLFRDSE